MAGQRRREEKFVLWLQEQPDGPDLAERFQATTAALPADGDWNSRFRTMLTHDLYSSFATDLIVELAAQLPEAPVPTAADGPP
jgi:hypothetical protein